MTNLCLVRHFAPYFKKTLVCDGFDESDAIVNTAPYDDTEIKIVCKKKKQPRKQPPKVEKRLKDRRKIESEIEAENLPVKNKLELLSVCIDDWKIHRLTNVANKVC
jgi:hypothetical protein